jgi:hypothetical protein
MILEVVLQEVLFRYSHRDEVRRWSLSCFYGRWPYPTLGGLCAMGVLCILIGLSALLSMRWCRPNLF